MKFFLSKLIATFFYSGLFPKAPGTVGTFVSMLAIYPFLNILSFYEKQYILYVVFFIGTIATYYYMEVTKKMDPKEVVIDETFGIFLCIFISEFFISNVSNLWLCIGCFVLFRFFDILKPYPISVIDSKMKNALGVMLDDGLAGIFASIVFVIIAKIFL